jgi:hypothetical protein
MRVSRLAVCLVVLSALLTIPVVAHQETHKGSVIAVEKVGVRVSVVDPKTKKTAPVLFEIDADTKILRDDKVVTLATARITKGEAIAVTVDHDVDEFLALVVRLGTSK